MEWLLLAAVVLAVLSALLALVSMLPTPHHPDIERIQHPLKPDNTADIERRNTDETA